MTTYTATVRSALPGTPIKRVTVNAASSAKAAAKLRSTNSKIVSGIRVNPTPMNDDQVTYVA